MCIRDRSYDFTHGIWPLRCGFAIDWRLQLQVNGLDPQVSRFEILGGGLNGSCNRSGTVSYTHLAKEAQLILAAHIDNGVDKLKRAKSPSDLLQY